MRKIPQQLMQHRLIGSDDYVTWSHLIKMAPVSHVSRLSLRTLTYIYFIAASLLDWSALLVSYSNWLFSSGS